MGRNRQRGFKDVTRDAISASRLDELLHPKQASGSGGAQDPRAAQEQRIMELADRNGIGRNSAEILLKNPWLQPFLDGAKKLNARVTEMETRNDAIVLTIKSPQAKHDVVGIAVKEDGSLYTSRNPKTVFLEQLVEKLAGAPRRDAQSLRATLPATRLTQG